MKQHIAACAVVFFAALPSVQADETGLASIHDTEYESGRRVCMTEHLHDGAGAGKTRKAAETAAKQAWTSFTAFEYGSDWGHYALAAHKTMECATAGGAWSCVTHARPCKHFVKPGSGGSESASR
jgi:hypothetical protein